MVIRVFLITIIVSIVFLSSIAGEAQNDLVGPSSRNLIIKKYMVMKWSGGGGPSGSAFLREDGGYILREDGSFILREN